ncbi:unnamed protein product [Closterium sp. Naga37s-1]|nr:unnamed protein product [Closterium sp. Naga37s-1]
MLAFMSDLKESGQLDEQGRLTQEGNAHCPFALLFFALPHSLTHPRPIPYPLSAPQMLAFMSDLKESGLLDEQGGNAQEEMESEGEKEGAKGTAGETEGEKVGVQEEAAGNGEEGVEGKEGKGMQEEEAIDGGGSSEETGGAALAESIEERQSDIPENLEKQLGKEKGEEGYQGEGEERAGERPQFDEITLGEEEQGQEQEEQGVGAAVAPSVWQAVLEPESGEYYYWNTVTGETSWSVPEELVQTEAAAGVGMGGTLEGGEGVGERGGTGEGDEEVGRCEGERREKGEEEGEERGEEREDEGGKEGDEEGEGERRDSARERGKEGSGGSEGDADVKMGDQGEGDETERREREGERVGERVVQEAKVVRKEGGMQGCVNEERGEEHVGMDEEEAGEGKGRVAERHLAGGAADVAGAGAMSAVLQSLQEQVDSAEAELAATAADVADKTEASVRLADLTSLSDRFAATAVAQSPLTGSPQPGVLQPWQQLQQRLLQLRLQQGLQGGLLVLVGHCLEQVVRVEGESEEVRGRVERVREQWEEERQRREEEENQRREEEEERQRQGEKEGKERLEEGERRLREQERRGQEEEKQRQEKEERNDEVRREAAERARESGKQEGPGGVERGSGAMWKGMEQYSASESGEISPQREEEGEEEVEGGAGKQVVKQSGADGLGGVDEDMDVEMELEMGVEGAGGGVGAAEGTGYGAGGGVKAAEGAVDGGLSLLATTLLSSLSCTLPLSFANLHVASKPKREAAVGSEHPPTHSLPHSEFPHTSSHLLVDTPPFHALPPSFHLP